MKSMKDFCPKASDAIQAMLDGLQELPSPKFEVAMFTFGDAYYNGSSGCVCYGCAATCAVQKATDTLFDYDSIHKRTARAKAVEVDEADLRRFETAIDKFRCGVADSLLAYYGHNPANFAEASDIAGRKVAWYLTDSNYNEPNELVYIHKYRDYLISLGL